MRCSFSSGHGSPRSYFIIWWAHLHRRPRTENRHSDPYERPRRNRQRNRMRGSRSQARVWRAMPDDLHGHGDLHHSAQRIRRAGRRRSRPRASSRCRGSCFPHGTSHGDRSGSSGVGRGGDNFLRLCAVRCHFRHCGNARRNDRAIRRVRRTHPYLCGDRRSRPLGALSLPEGDHLPPRACPSRASSALAQKFQNGVCVGPRGARRSA